MFEQPARCERARRWSCEHPRVNARMGGLGTDMVVVKQYGERRTGTNALRALLMENFADLLVLMHVLGDKHSAPVDLAAHVRAWQALAPDVAADRDLVRSATMAAPAMTTDEHNERQRARLDAVAGDVARAVRSSSLRYLISVRDPYTWLPSVLAFHGFLPYGILDLRTVQCATAMCERANRMHAAWSALLDDEAQRCTVVRFEDQVADPLGVALRVGKSLGVSRKDAGGPALDIERNVLPAGWDHSPPELGMPWQPPPGRDVVFESCSYLAALASDRIDWSLHSRFGYDRR